MALPRNLINQRIPFQLGARPTGSASTFGNPTGTFDFAFGGIPFLSAAGTSNYQYGAPRALARATAQFKRDQFDASPEPGEQSLTGWWLRSQSSFHNGSGLRFEDPTLEENRFRFESSSGVNVWTPGQVSLLKTTTVRQAGTTPSLCHGAVDGTTDIVLFASASNLYRVTSGASAAVTWGGSGNILSLTDDGSSYYAANATSIFKGTLAGGAGAALWNTGNASVVLGWVKQRLMAGIGNKIYELAGGSPPALPTTATYTHPNANWVWTAFAEGPNAIYAAGYAGGRSVILRIDVNTSGALPTLTQASTVAEMPTGEIIYSLRGHTGTYLGIGTSNGVRVAQIGSSGLLEVGPLIPTPQPVKALTALSDAFYAGYTSGFTDGSGLLRVALTNPLQSNLYPYASDLNAHVAGAVTGVCVRGASGVLAFAVDGQGLYESHATDLEPTGTLTTNRIRYSTLWPKLFKRISLRAVPPYDGTIGVSTVDQSGTLVTLATVAPSMSPNDDLGIAAPGSPQQYIQLVFQLNRSIASNLLGPNLGGYQLKALPGGPRPRQLTIPVQCFNFEKDRAGTPVGYEGWASDRLTAMEAADSAGDLITFQDLVSGTSQVVLIEQLEFTQTAPPGPDEGLGGVLLIQCRTID